MKIVRFLLSELLKFLKDPIKYYTEIVELRSYEEEVIHCRLHHYGSNSVDEPVTMDEWCLDGWRDGKYSKGCGRPVSSTFKFCPYCGIELIKEEHYPKLLNSR